MSDQYGFIVGRPGEKPPLPPGSPPLPPGTFKYGVKLATKNGQQVWEAATESDWIKAESKRLGRTVQTADVGGCGLTNGFCEGSCSPYPGLCVPIYDGSGNLLYCACQQ